MGMYRITIDRLDNTADEPTVRVIECHSPFILQSDLSDWVREEVDPTARIRDVPRPDFCQACQVFDCDKCTDSEGATCKCARMAHGRWEARPIMARYDLEKCPVTKSAHIPVTESGVTTCEECAWELVSVWRPR